MTWQKIHLKRLFWGIWSISIMAGIFWFSSQTGETSGALSGGLLNFLLDWLGISITPEQMSTFHLLLRKLAHFSIYAMLGIGVMGYCLTFPGKSWKKFLLSLFICAVYASTDEFHQLFVGNRCGSPLDVLLDSFGAAFGCGLILSGKTWLLNRHKAASLFSDKT